MRRTLIFTADNNEVITLVFSKAPWLNGKKYGMWNTDTNEIDLCTEAWDLVIANKDNIRKLKPMMDKLEKFSAMHIPKEIK